MPENRDRRPALTRSAHRPILPPSTDQIADAYFHDSDPASHRLNTARTIGVVSETGTFDTWFGRAIRPVGGRTIGGNGIPARADYCHRRASVVARKRHAPPADRRQPVQLARAARLTSLQPVEDMHERQLVARKIIWNGDSPVADVGCVLALAFARKTNRQIIGRPVQKKLFRH